MRSLNKTRYAILGVLQESSSTGYEIKSLMSRSTSYFWRESDSTIYPMLKVLKKEGKVDSEKVSIGKKKKEVFTITELGREEFDAWIKASTGQETPRNEFLLKLFFLTDSNEIQRLYRERLQQAKASLEEYQEIQERLNAFTDSPQKNTRLKALEYGISQLRLEIQWLKKSL